MFGVGCSGIDETLTQLTVNSPSQIDVGKAEEFGQQPQARPKPERKKIKNRATKSRFLRRKNKTKHLGPKTKERD